MSANRYGSSDAEPRRTSIFGIVGILLAAASLFLPAVPALVTAAGAIILGVLARRQVKRDPRTGPLWVSLIALIAGGFVFLSQAVILAVVTFTG
jgi:hypothetical protein